MDEDSNIPTNDGDGRKSRVPALNIPPLLTAALALLFIVYVIETYVLSDDMRAALFFYLGFIPGRYSVTMSEQGLELLWTPITYSFLHGGIEHILFNALWLAAFGTPVLRRIGTLRFVILWCLAASVAAFFHAALHWGEMTLLIGASGVVSAFMGAACRFAFPANGRDGVPPQFLPRQTIFQSFTNRTVLIFMGVWLAGNLLVAVGLPLVGDVGGQIAWDAHIGGFVFGFLTFGFFDSRR